MDITLLGDVVNYRRKAYRKSNFLADAVVTRVHPDKMVDLYILKKNQPVNIKIDVRNNKAYVLNPVVYQERYNIHYSDEPIPGTWGHKE
jgi:hypothetical protein